MTQLDDHYAFREAMVKRLEADLLGPGDGEEEILDEEPLDRYIVGVLWPSSEEAQAETPEEPSDAQPDPDTADDAPVSQARMRYPTSAGITFSVDTRATSSVSVECSAARYAPVDESVPAADEAEQRSRARRTRQSTRWARIPATSPDVVLNLNQPGTDRKTVAEGLQLYTLVRTPRDGIVTVTAALVNVNAAPTSGGRDALSWFQPCIVASTAVPAFVDRNLVRDLSGDEDIDSGALLYRNARSFAVGHGCAATWEQPGPGAAMVDRVRTSFVPRHELPRAKTNELAGIDLRMSSLATGSDETTLTTLRGLVRAYRAWIQLQRDSLAEPGSDVPAPLQPVATRHLDRAIEAAGRIDEGIRQLATSRDAMAAFKVMNAAMQTQRARQEWIRSGAQGTPDDGAEQTWRPFQIAFILINLPGVSERTHQDRNIADLLWFPTGGGKTEAYLGLVAYTMLHRRLRDRDATGVAAIMRYTLRLLTIQQFERATMLMCALERLRADKPDNLGERQFSIGLWVGRGATPNTLDDASSALRKLKQGLDVEEGNPVQILRCPWCGTPLGPEEYRVVTGPPRRLRIACGRVGCDFADGLPVHVVDEDVYRARPDFVIGTVDKFAQMAWSPRVGALFGRDGQGLQPELIVQDELHLISGPLGSMVGLYETAVDAACSVNPWTPDDLITSRPKIVASTATIRRAPAQVRAVFDRTAAQFPPPGIDPDQSFFSEPATREEFGTREYVGVMAPGTSQQTLMVRVYASLLQSVADLPGSPTTCDPYWTLIGYFNSLRVLGSAYLQVQDDVRTRLNVLAGRFGTAPRQVRGPSELTSRVPSREIPDRLKALELSLETGGAEDVVLATNMISVGLDVDRLGLMTVMGQPQSSAEYIQATSRIGRRHPGLVVTILNSARSRDRSHYENFLPFHQSIYRAVEATSATPFAARARDRGLHGVLVSLARLLFTDLSRDDAAHLVDGQEQKLRRAAELIVERAEAVSAEGDETQAQIAELVKVWTRAAAERPNLRYRDRYNPLAALLIDPGDALVNEDIDYSMTDIPWPTLQSLRDVDAESGLYQIPMRWSK
jgi:hypothetical protein